MSIWRVILSILFLPLALIGKGCGSMIIVFLITLCCWLFGVAAIMVRLKKPDS